MTKRIIFIAIVVAVVCSCGQAEQGRWSVEKANEWMNKQGWIVGCDYKPTYAVNSIEFWQEETFNIKQIDRELGYAEGLGFNTIRVFLAAEVCIYEKNGFKQRFDQFLDVCQSHGIRVIVTMVPTNGRVIGHLGKQIDPPYGVHNPSANIPVPDNAPDEIQWLELEKMTKDIVRTYRKDDRILMWHLCNEPEGHKPGKSSVPLLTAAFKWARSCRPTQPISSPIWRIIGVKGTSMPEVSFLLENCDIISFHCYNNGEVLERFIAQLLPYGRPMICTEYMGRPESIFLESMPILKKYNIGAISWGLAAGKDNTIFPWNKKDENGVPIPWETEPEVWFHNILYPDGTPYSEDEVEFIRKMTGGADK